MGYRFNETDTHIGKHVTCYTYIKNGKVELPDWISKVNINFVCYNQQSTLTLV